MNRPMSKPSPSSCGTSASSPTSTNAISQSLAEEFNERKFSAGDKVALEGEGGLMFFVVESGELAVEVHGEPCRRWAPAPRSARSR